MKEDIPSQRFSPAAGLRQLSSAFEFWGITTPWSVERSGTGGLKDGRGACVSTFKRCSGRYVVLSRNATGRARSGNAIQAGTRWRHLDTCTVPNRVARFVAANGLPRAQGQGELRVPWARPRSRFTAAVCKRLVIRLVACRRANRRSPDVRTGAGTRVHGIMDRAVKQGPGAPPSRTGRLAGCGRKIVSGKGTAMRAVVNDLDRGTRVVCRPRTVSRDESGWIYWGTLTPAQKEGIQGVAIDMWDAYETSVRFHLPNGQHKVIVFDKFHVAYKHLGDAD